MDKGLKDVILEHGQYRDVLYIPKKAKAIRCLVVPAREIEPLLMR